MTKESAIKLFEQKQVRSVWNEEEEQWYFSPDSADLQPDSADPDSADLQSVPTKRAK